MSKVNLKGQDRSLGNHLGNCYHSGLQNDGGIIQGAGAGMESKGQIQDTEQLALSGSLDVRHGIG
jgi:hypothetical protein